MIPNTDDVLQSKYAELTEKCYRLRNNIEFGSSFYFVYDVIKERYLYLEEEFYPITGYPSSLIVKSKVDFLAIYMHPDDLSQYDRIKSKWIDSIENHFKKERAQINISFDFRLKNQGGRSIRLLYQTLHYEFSFAGKILYIIGKCSDISHWNKSNDMVLSIAYPCGVKNFKFHSTTKVDTHADVFSSLEKKIIRLLAEGCNSKAIAGEMDITFNTANTHRRNMLRKAKVRNTSELVSFAHSHQLV